LSKPKLLLGEGVEEVMVFSALLQHLGIPDVQVADYGGKPNLHPYLDGLARMTGFRGLHSIGVTRDADDELPVDVFTKVIDFCRNIPGQPYALPTAPGLMAAGRPNVALFILPDNTRCGMLEDVCWQAVQYGPAIGCVDEFLRCVQQRAARQALPKDMPKARMHAWLSSQDPPDRRLGEAAGKKGWLDFDHACFQPLKDFIRQL
jgi:hypothetical protein